MTQDEFNSLYPGDIVCGRSTGLAYMVTDRFSDRVIAVRTMDLTNPAEWDLVSKAKHERE